MELSTPTTPQLTAGQLAQYVTPRRVGDPLGLGRDRPPAPADPDPHNCAREDRDYARSLLSEQERVELDKAGYLTIEQVRGLVAQNCAKSGGLDPEMLALVDARVNYKIFVAGDELYLREDLYEHYPFHEFGVQPEAVFAQQELGVFPAGKYSMGGELEYIARDAGDESVEFATIEDLVGKATRPGYEAKREPLRIVKTKIYVGREQWEDFKVLQKFFRGAARVATAQIAYNKEGASTGYGGVLSMFMPRGNLLTNREEDLSRREEEVKRREEEAARREEEARRTQQRLEADIKRIERMLAGARPGAAPSRGTAQDGADAEDSVAL